MDHGLGKGKGLQGALGPLGQADRFGGGKRDSGRDGLAATGLPETSGVRMAVTAVS